MTTIGKGDWIATVPPLVTAMTSMISTYIAIPKIIAKYLFNKDEEANMTSVVGKIQEYDTNVRGTINK